MDPDVRNVYLYMLRWHNVPLNVATEVIIEIARNMANQAINRLNIKGHTMKSPR